MLTHAQIWAAIDALAERHALSASALARRAGLDPTTFNPSKRLAGDGRPRWPSTESIAKVLEATGERLDAFMALIASRESGRGSSMSARRVRHLPLIGFAQAGAGGFFGDGGFPVGEGWDEIAFPTVDDAQAYALEVAGDSMWPLYRDGDRIIVSPNAAVRRGDRVVLKTVEGEVMAKELKRRTAKVVELRSLNPEHPDRIIPVTDIAWVARVLWASQ